MKKIFFFAASAVLALASCSDDAISSNNGGNSIPNGDELVPVELALTRSSVEVLKTRGTGTVGGFDTAESSNDYKHEDLFVLMTTVNKPTWGLTETGSLGKQFDASFIARPEESEAEPDPVFGKVWDLDYTTYTNGANKYYPTNGIYSDFFAFYVDDAAKITGAENAPMTISGDSITVDFKINGTQDLLAGKATNGAKIDAEDEDSRTGFSAKTARNNLIPRIPMQHLLTRLTFAIRPGNKQAEGIIIDSIRIAPKYSSGKLTVAYDMEGVKNPDSLIVWKDEAKVDSFLLHSNGKEGNMQTDDDKLAKDTLAFKSPLLVFDTDKMVEATSDTYDYDPVSVGHAFFLKPYEYEYGITIFYRLPYKDGTEESTYMSAADDLYVRLGKDEEGKYKLLERGKSYNVIITLYGLNEIKIETVLEAWVDGGDIELDTDDASNSLPTPEEEPEP